ncbi:hypothetical protein ANN_25459 [Periplaneta americana]|uniref:Uncharacterized protein n=1 Tax=Periplaneta americana TaxID=6978 RepID=A0ABQ8S1X8_PERAM|nr:hypothetical protein ANN_25459 [Periplaneta americana]
MNAVSRGAQFCIPDFKEQNKRRWKPKDQEAEPDVCREIKARRVRWLGHICRKDENDPCKKLTFTIPFGTRKVGRPQLRWLDEVEKEIIAAGVRRWKTKVLDRRTWKSIVGAVKAGTRL